ncbi:hypothetical protein DL96DRAFT_1621813 [Flagelloscypha sp. PMI_526]|nr:hypothetical protein DL96DRAFT_1621813 [Flagelloscypha sp. PMI_526]
MTDTLLATYWLAVPTWDSKEECVSKCLRLASSYEDIHGTDCYSPTTAVRRCLAYPLSRFPLFLSYSLPAIVTSFPPSFVEICRPEVYPFDTEGLQDKRTLAADGTAVSSILYCIWESLMIPNIHSLAIYGFFLMVPDNFFKPFGRRDRGLTLQLPAIVQFWVSLMGHGGTLRRDVGTTCDTSYLF